MTYINQNYTITLSEQSFQGPSILLLDSEKRIRYNNSFWDSIFHFKEKQQLNQAMWQTVSTFFQQRYQIENPQHFLRIWKEIGQKEWSLKSPLTVGQLRAIDANFKRRLVYHGQGMAPLPSSIEHSNSTVQQIVNACLHGGSLSVNIIQKPILQAVFVRHDPTLLKQFRHELQLEIDHVAKNPPKNAQEEIVWRQFLGNIIALLPYSYPDENEVFNIPVLEADGTCRQVVYKANVIELTPNHLSTPVSAIGLTPVNDVQASPILSFLGTTYPAGNGFSATIKADFTPNMSVGEDVYRQGKAKIANWFKNKSNVHLIGTSLGGALAFHALLDHHSKLSRVDAYNPPGLYAHCWKNRFFNEGCEINIYRQPKDIVSKMGFWPTGNKVKIFNIIPHQKGIVEGMPRSHMQVYSGCQKVTFLKGDPAAENKSPSRKALVYLHRYIGPFVFFYPTCFILWCYHIVRAIQKCWQNAFGKKCKYS